MPTVQLPPKESNLFKRILVSGRRARRGGRAGGDACAGRLGLHSALCPSPSPRDPTPRRAGRRRAACVPTRAAVRAPPRNFTPPPRAPGEARPAGSGPRAARAAVRPGSPPRRSGPPSVFLCPRPRGQVLVPCFVFNLSPSASRSLLKRGDLAAGTERSDPGPGRPGLLVGEPCVFSMYFTSLGSEYVTRTAFLSNQVEHDTLPLTRTGPALGK